MIKRDDHNQFMKGGEIRSNSLRRVKDKGIILPVFLAVLLAACATPEDKSTETGVPPTINNITANPAAYVGKTVTVKGEVEDLRGPQAFTLDGDGIAGGELLVVGKDPFPVVPGRTADAYLVRDDEVQVTGTVRMFVATEIEREIGWDLDPQLEIEFQGQKPVLIANSLNVTRATATPTPAGAAREPIADLLVIITAGDRLPLVGRRVLLSNVKVQSMAGDRGFWIGPSDAQRLFVRMDKDFTAGRGEKIVNVNQGQIRTLGGVINRLPSQEEMKKQWGLSASEAARLERDRIYLEADNIELLEKKP